MSITVGPIVASNVTNNSAQLAWTPAAGGVAPYTYAIYRSTQLGFTPGSGNLLASGLTSPNYNDSGLIANTQYYYEVIATDSTSATGDSAQLGVLTTPQQLQQNALFQTPIIGKLDQEFNYNVKAAMIDPTYTGGPIYPGTAMKRTNTTSPIPTVVPCTADTDQVYGFLVYDIQSPSFVAGQPVQVAQGGCVMWLSASSAIVAGAQAQLDVTSPATLTAEVGSSGANLCAWAYDQAAGYGSVIRFEIKAPNFAFA